MEVIGATTLYQLNCFQGFPLLQDNSIDLIATDPPYFLHGMGDEWSDQNLQKSSARAKTIGSLPVGMKFDPAQGIRLEQFFYQVAQQAFRVLKPGGFMLVFAQGRLYHRMAIAVENAGFEIRDMLIWEHQGGQGKSFTQDHFVRRQKLDSKTEAEIITRLAGRKTPQLRPKFEPILLAQKPKEGTFVNNWLQWETGLIDPRGEEGQQSTIFKAKKPRKNPDLRHLTIKPEPLMERLIEVFSLKGQIVLDPFLGSGTTAIAARNLGRAFIGFEINPDYFQQALTRLKT